MSTEPAFEQQTETRSQRTDPGQVVAVVTVLVCLLLAAQLTGIVLVAALIAAWFWRKLPWALTALFAVAAFSVLLATFLGRFWPF